MACVGAGAGDANHTTCLRAEDVAQMRHYRFIRSTYPTTNNISQGWAITLHRIQMERCYCTGGLSIACLSLKPSPACLRNDQAAHSLLLVANISCPHMLSERRSERDVHMHGASMAKVAVLACIAGHPVAVAVVWWHAVTLIPLSVDCSLRKPQTR